jgi:hypothetical protein
LQKPGNLAGHYLRTHILMATSIIYKTAWIQNASMNIKAVSY